MCTIIKLTQDRRLRNEKTRYWQQLSDFCLCHFGTQKKYRGFGHRRKKEEQKMDSLPYHCSMLSEVLLNTALIFSRLDTIHQELYVVSSYQGL